MVATLSSVVVTTDNLDLAREYFELGLKLLPVQTHEPDIAGLSRLWGLKGPHAVKMCDLKRRVDDEHGYIRLVEISDAEGVDIAEGYQPYDLGVLDFGFTVLDVHRKVATIAALGYEVIGPPTRYDFNYYKDREPFYVFDSLVAGPNHIRVDLLERVNASYAYGQIDESTGFSQIGHAALIVEDIDEAVAFYRDIVGVPLRGLFRDVHEPAFVALLKTAPGENIDWAFLVDSEGRGSTVELIAPLGRGGRQIAGQGDMCNYGVAALSFGVPDVLATHRLARDSHVEIVCEPVELRTGRGETELAFSCYAPSRILCEIRQRPG